MKFAKTIRIALILSILAVAALPMMAGEGCSTEKGHGECPMKHAKAVSSEEVVLTGKLLCLHCNLKEKDSCEKVFVTEDDSRYALCPAGDVKAAESISEHGEATIVVKGKATKLEDGTTMLRIASAEKSS